MIDRATFEQLVDEALASLPDEIAAWLDNVAIVVGEWPSPQQLSDAGLGSAPRCAALSSTRSATTLAWMKPSCDQQACSAPAPGFPLAPA
jgi:predicted Zn-dependent protease with MMP-like domain